MDVDDGNERGGQDTGDLGSAGPEPKIYRLTFLGEGHQLGIMVLKHIVLIILTLGLYSFRAKVEERKYIWQHAVFEGQKFRYHGTAMELFKGRLFAIAVLFAVFAINSATAKAGGIVSIVGPLAFLGSLAVVIPAITFAKRRYLPYLSHRLLAAWA